MNDTGIRGGLFSHYNNKGVVGGQGCRGSSSQTSLLFTPRFDINQRGVEQGEKSRSFIREYDNKRKCADMAITDQRDSKRQKIIQEAKMAHDLLSQNTAGSEKAAAVNWQDKSNTLSAHNITLFPQDSTVSLGVSSLAESSPTNGSSFTHPQPNFIAGGGLAYISHPQRIENRTIRHDLARDNSNMDCSSDSTSTLHTIIENRLNDTLNGSNFDLTFSPNPIASPLNSTCNLLSGDNVSFNCSSLDLDKIGNLLMIDSIFFFIYFCLGTQPFLWIGESATKQIELPALSSKDCSEEPVHFADCPEGPDHFADCCISTPPVSPRTIPDDIGGSWPHGGGDSVFDLFERSEIAIASQNNQEFSETPHEKTYHLNKSTTKQLFGTVEESCCQITQPILSQESAPIYGSMASFCKTNEFIDEPDKEQETEEDKWIAFIACLLYNHNDITSNVKLLLEKAKFIELLTQLILQSNVTKDGKMLLKYGLDGLSKTLTS